MVVADFCCERFKESVQVGKFEKAEEQDETEWYIPEWLHIYFCPFCGTSLKGSGFGTYDTAAKPVGD